MTARDPHRFINDLDNETVGRLIARLENRAKDAAFTRLFDKYVSQLVLPANAQILEIGCGTGAMSRLLAKRNDFSGNIFGVDHCAAFIEAAGDFARDEGVGDKINFRVSDAHSLDFPPATFDAVIAHTLISHVSDPESVIREMAYVVRPGGTVVIFDGDYASLTYASLDHGLGDQMDKALTTATFNNPRVMRDLPRLLPELGLKLTSSWGDVVAEIGQASYFKSFAEAYAPYVISAGLMTEEQVEDWLSAQRQSMDNGSFFASCNYYTYLACLK